MRTIDTIDNIIYSLASLNWLIVYEAAPSRAKSFILIPTTFGDLFNQPAKSFYEFWDIV